MGQNISLKPFIITIVAFLLVAYGAKAGENVPGCDPIKPADWGLALKLVDATRLAAKVVVKKGEPSWFESNRKVSNFVNGGFATYHSLDIELSGKDKFVKANCELVYAYSLAEDRKSCHHSWNMECKDFKDAKGKELKADEVDNYGLVILKKKPLEYVHNNTKVSRHFWTTDTPSNPKTLPPLTRVETAEMIADKVSNNVKKSLTLFPDEKPEGVKPVPTPKAKQAN